MRIATRESLLRASELCETMSDVLVAASFSEEGTEASHRLLRMSDNALAAAKALEKIGKAKPTYQRQPTAVVQIGSPIAEPQQAAEIPARVMEREDPKKEMMQL
jgi:hypothetical protein